MWLCSALLLTCSQDGKERVISVGGDYSFARQRAESQRSAVDEHLKATMSHQKQASAVRSLDGFASQAPLSSLDMLAYALANEQLMQNGAFSGWRSAHHAMTNVREHTFIHSLGAVSRDEGEASLSRALHHGSRGPGSGTVR